MSSASPSERWAQPTEVRDLDLAFPARALELMPERELCEAALAALPDSGRYWRQFQSTWFFQGLSADTTFELVEGIEGRAALRHLQVIQGSFAPRHEHKQAAVAYLASRWFAAVHQP